MMQRVAVCRSVLQGVAGRCSESWCIANDGGLSDVVCCGVLRCVTVCCGVMRRVAVCCRVLQ